MDIEEEIEERRRVFRAALASSSNDIAVVRAQIFDGQPYALDPGAAYGLAEEIATQFDVHPNQDVYLVGSSKLGFSIKPERRWGSFGDKSDIDVAIISTQRFVALWEEIDALIRSPSSWSDRESYRKYVSAGWIRPDLLPVAMRDEWFEFFEELQKTRQYGGGIRIRAGLYYNAGFLERYQASAVKLCREEGT